MAKRLGRFEKVVARIRTLREEGPASATEELRPLLADREPYLAGAAADAAVALGLRGLVPDLAAALVRTVRNEQPDVGCLASEKVAEALVRLEADEVDAYRVGLGYVRMEMPGPIDRAIAVRILCVNGIARTLQRGALLDIVPLLADKRPEVRAGTATAIGLLHGEGPAAVLHLMLLRGDDEAPEVLGACVASLLRLDPSRYLPVAAELLDDERLAEHAALALGESRLPEALPVLLRGLEATHDPKRAGLILLAMALHRSGEAVAALFEVLEHGRERIAAEAVHALAVHRHSNGIPERVEAIVHARASAHMGEAFASAFRQSQA